MHPDPDTLQAAQEACLSLNAFVEELNTHVGLYSSLRALMQHRSFQILDEVTQRTAQVFMHDFEISGIHLEYASRKKVVDLNRRLLEIGYDFSSNALHPTCVREEDCPPSLRGKFVEEGSFVLVDHIPFHDRNPEVRKLAYLSYYTPDVRKMEAFEALITNRRSLARLVGYPSHAHRVLKMSMAESPETVMEFLDRLSERVWPLAAEDVDIMRRVKQQNSHLFSSDDKNTVSSWDVPLLMSKAKKLHLPSKRAGTDSAHHHFSLDSCVAGLTHLFKCLFGIRLQPLPTKRGEVWHPDVYKFGFFDDNQEGCDDGGQLLGYTYADLFNREGKLASDCHFTIRGGREVKSDIDGVDGCYYQTPIIALCCSFEPHPQQQRPGDDKKMMLTWHMAETLFHEMGHALHSMLGRARYQNVTGTRCSTDFAEVPSTLMELFFQDHRVLQHCCSATTPSSLLLPGGSPSTPGGHHRDNKPLQLPPDLMSTLQLNRHLFVAYDTQIQIANAVADQRFHTSDVGATFPANNKSNYLPLNEGAGPGVGWSVDIYREAAERYSPLGHTPDTAYYLRFLHLVSYGGRYYSYLWARAVACLLWRGCGFSKDPFSESAGRGLRAMLSVGGGASPRRLVAEVLGFEPSVEQLVDALYQDILKQRGKMKAISSIHNQ